VSTFLFVALLYKLGQVFNNLIWASEIKTTSIGGTAQSTKQKQHSKTAKAKKQY
jgi:hypothetical protein